jgi:5-methyltetrahydrofolate--homocysteine methyltransferase
MTNSNHKNNRYLAALQDRILVYDGAMGTSIQSLDLSVEDYGGVQYDGCNDYLVISKPEAIESIHRSFLDVGVDVIETNTFRANRITLADYGLQDKAYEINKTAATIARKVADEYGRGGQERFVAGSVGPTGKLPSMDDPELSDISFSELSDVFYEQALALVEGGVDLLLIETSQDILEVKAAILGFERAFEETGIHLPIQAQVTLDTTGRMLLGTDIAAALAILEGMSIQVIGLNCSTGPDHMREPISFLSENSILPVSCIPNAGLPLNIDGEAVYPLEPIPFADIMTEFVKKHNVNIVGGCCGTTPEHMKLLVDKVRGRKSMSRGRTHQPQLASAIQAMSMHQEPAPFLIGERLNTQGSRKFKRLMLEGDFESVLPIAMQQINSGAHGLDISTALTERPDEAELMRQVIKILAPVVPVPLVIDTTELDVMETALQTAPGRCLLNSTNLEAGREKADRVFALAKKYNAAVIALTIDELGMAKTSQRKLDVARVIYDIAVKDHGLKPGDLVFDPLTFTLATGDPEYSNSAMETFEGIRRIKSELPGVLTSLGISNVSFGLSPPARTAINSVMLYHAVQAGMDMAIVNAAHITPYADISSQEREKVEDLIFNRKPDALQHLIEYFDDVGTSVKAKEDNQKEALLKMTPEERLRWRIIHRNKEDIESDIDKILDSEEGGSKHPTAIKILNEVLLPAMKEVGDRFGSGELILPFVLQSAEVMKKSVAHLENFLEKKEGVTKGKLILATVYGDVHDIGKNLVKTILSNNGYQVIDLVKRVPAETIISRAVEERADAIGLSALLVSTSKQMPIIVNELHRRELDFPVLIGGAAINPRFGRRILLTDQEAFYEPGVFYCKDAFDGLATMEKLMNDNQRVELLHKAYSDADRELGIKLSPPRHAHIQDKRPEFDQAEFIPSSPGWGTRVVREMPLDSIFQYLNKKELFRLSWGAKNARGEKWQKLKAEFEGRLELMHKDALQDEWLHPQGVYGYWPAQSDGDDLILYEPDSLASGNPLELIRFSNPRQVKGEFICLSDYFTSVDSGIMDIVALQVVTVGHDATERFDKLQESGEFSEAYFTHGLAVQIAEATAEYLHRHIKRELGLSPGQGKRYSWGFPAIPEIEDHAKVFKLLPAEDELGMELTSAFQLVPEQSTAAIIVHHPKAKYYDIGKSRISQLMKNQGKSVRAS